jgi:hypothetical protein
MNLSHSHRLYNQGTDKQMTILCHLDDNSRSASAYTWEWNQSPAPGVPPIEASFGREEIAIPVKCNIHPWMKGYIAVLKHPYFTITGKDGEFVLKNLPPGSYTVTAWHEKFGTLTQQVTIAPSEMKKVEFTFKP